MALNEFEYSVHKSGATVIKCTRRLQHWGRDAFIYANEDFATSEFVGETNELLEKLLVQLRRNDSGIDQIQVTPFSVAFYGAGSYRSELMFLQASRIAGLKAIRR